MRLAFTPEAQEQADECDAWWREHRTATRELFAHELAGIKALLLDAPHIGSIYTVLDGLPVRRVLLPKTSTHVYYSIDAERSVVMVLAVWGAPKGRGPRL
jgi:plasmid stabilization system protein ParE